MNNTFAGALTGAVLAFAVLQFGFWGFLLVVVFMGIGILVSRGLSGELDIHDLIGIFTGRRTSS